MTLALVWMIIFISQGLIKSTKCQPTIVYTIYSSFRKIRNQTKVTRIKSRPFRQMESHEIIILHSLIVNLQKIFIIKWKKSSIHGQTILNTRHNTQLRNKLVNKKRVLNLQIFVQEKTFRQVAISYYYINFCWLRLV